MKASEAVELYLKHAYRTVPEEEIQAIYERIRKACLAGTCVYRHQFKTKDPFDATNITYRLRREGYHVRLDDLRTQVWISW